MPAAAPAGAAAEAWPTPYAELAPDPSSAWPAVLVTAALALAGLVCAGVLLARFARRPPDLAARVRLLLWRPWLERDGLRLGLALAALQLAALFLLRHGAARYGEARAAAAGLLVQGLLFHGVVLAAVTAWLRRRRVSWRSAFGWRARRLLPDAARGLAAYLALLPLVLVYSVAYQQVLVRLGVRPEPQPVFLLLREAAPWLRGYVLFVGVALAPLAEEVLFRGLALPLAARRFGTAPAVVLVSAVFALLHFHLPSFAPLFVLGVGFSLAYLLTGSLAVPVAMHAFFNGVNLAILHGLG